VERLLWYVTSLLSRGENLWFPHFPGFMVTWVSGEWAMPGGQLSLRQLRPGFKKSERVVGGGEVKAGETGSPQTTHHSGHVLECE
jgi:hypothetical protein